MSRPSQCLLPHPSVMSLPVRRGCRWTREPTPWCGSTESVLPPGDLHLEHCVIPEPIFPTHCLWITRLHLCPWAWFFSAEGTDLVLCRKINSRLSLLFHRRKESEGNSQMSHTWGFILTPPYSSIGPVSFWVILQNVNRFGTSRLWGADKL